MDEKAIVRLTENVMIGRCNSLLDLPCEHYLSPGFSLFSSGENSSGLFGLLPYRKKASKVFFCYEMS